MAGLVERYTIFKRKEGQKRRKVKSNKAQVKTLPKETQSLHWIQNFKIKAQNSVEGKMTKNGGKRRLVLNPRD